MAYNNKNMVRIAQIGAMARPQVRTMPTLDLGGAIDNFMDSRNNAEQRSRRQAYVDQLTQEHPQDAARIAADPAAYMAMLDENAKADRDQQYKLAQLQQQFSNSMALENMRNANAIGLAKLQAQLQENSNQSKNNIAQDELQKRINMIEQLHDTGKIQDDQYIKSLSNIYNLGLDTPKQTSLKDFASAVKDLAGANVDVDALNQYVANNGFEGLKFNPAEKKYASGDLGLVQMMTDEGIPLSDALTRVGKMTPEDKLAYEIKKAQNTEEIKFGFNSALEKQKQAGAVDLANLNSQNSLNNNMIIERMKNENDAYARLQQAILDIQKAQAQNEINKNFETFKSELPTETIRNARQMSLLTGEPVDNILMQDYQNKQIAARKALADIDYTQAQTKKAMREIVNSIPANSPDGTPLTGNKKYDEAYMKEVGKKAAERDIMYKDASDELEIFEDTSKRIEELLPKAAIDTFIQRNMPTMFFDEDTQKARQELRNILGGLRLDQMQYLKGAISDKEQAFLSDVVSGDITKYTPNEIRGTINSIKRKMKNKVKRYSPQQSVSVDDPLGIL